MKVKLLTLEDKDGNETQMIVESVLVANENMMSIYQIDDILVTIFLPNAPIVSFTTKTIDITREQYHALSDGGTIQISELKL